MSFREPLTFACEQAIAFLESLDVTPANARVSLEELRSRLGGALPPSGKAPRQVIEELVRDSEGGIVGSAGGRFYAWVVGGSLPAALAADWLTAAWEQNAGIAAAGPAAAVCEEVAGAWIKDLLGLPAHATFAFVTGCQMAHVTCLAAARHALMARGGWDVERQGLYGARPIRIVTGCEHHGSFDRAVRYLGLGLDHVVRLPVESDGRLAPETLEHALAAERGPAIVLLMAGDLNTGIFDPFEALIPIARRYGAWVHIDGAFGLWAGASPKFHHLTAGVDAADSWATDGHKWLNVPYDCGYAFVADPAAHRAAMSHRESYLIHDSEARDQMNYNPEWSRRARGFGTYAALRQLGRDGVAELVERCCHYAHEIVTRIGALEGAAMMWEPIINQGLVRFLDARAGAKEEDHDRHTDAVIANILASGEAFVGGATWRGRRVMRVSVSNWQTTGADVERTVAAAALAIATLR